MIHHLKSAFPQVGRGGEKGHGEEGGCSTRVRKRKPDLTEGGEPHSGCVVPISPRLFTKMAPYGCIPQATEANEKLFEEKSSQELKEFQPNTLAKQTNRQLMTTGQKNKGNQSCKIQCLDSRLDTAKERKSELKKQIQRNYTRTQSREIKR